jgi:hypothetical protein
MENNFISMLDIYEVDKTYYYSYVYRCKNRQLMKRHPHEGLTVWEDIETGKLLYGKEVTNVMASEATRFFIFELLDEELLGPEKTTQIIEIDYETYKNFLEAVASKNEKEDLYGKNLFTSRGREER